MIVMVAQPDQHSLGWHPATGGTVLSLPGSFSTDANSRHRLKHNEPTACQMSSTADGRTVAAPRPRHRRSALGGADVLLRTGPLIRKLLRSAVAASVIGVVAGVAWLVHGEKLPKTYLATLGDKAAKAAPRRVSPADRLARGR